MTKLLAVYANAPLRSGCHRLGPRSRSPGHFARRHPALRIKTTPIPTHPRQPARPRRSQCAGTQGPHAVCQITAGTVGTKNATYSYDANGNLLGGDGRAVSWSAFDKPLQIAAGGTTTNLRYGPERELLSREEITGAGTTATVYVGGLYESVTLPGGGLEERHYVGDSTLVTITGRTAAAAGSSTTKYLHKDHLGSVVSITDASGAEVESFGFDAWGKRRAPTLASLVAKVGSPWTTFTAWQKGNLTIAAILLGSGSTNRGFTGHEQLDGVGLVHMGGRVYDAEIGRFLSADPFVQDSTDLQSQNRYSYVQNNPLSYTDPSGYFLKKLFKRLGGAIGDAVDAVGGAVKKALVRIGRLLGEVPGLQAFVGAAVCVGSGGLLCAQVAYVMAGLNAAITVANGGTIGQALAGLAVAGIAYGMQGLGNAFLEGGGLTGLLGDALGGEFGGQVAASLIMGGTISKAQGGSFQDGVLAAGIGAAAGAAGRFVGSALKAPIDTRLACDGCDEYSTAESDSPQLSRVRKHFERNPEQIQEVADHFRTFKGKSLNADLAARMFAAYIDFQRGIQGEFFEGIDINIPRAHWDRYLKLLTLGPHLRLAFAARFGSLPRTAGEAMQFWHTSYGSGHVTIVAKYQNAVNFFNYQKSNPDL